MKVLVIFSGGLDSSVCLAKAIKEYGKKNVIALSFDYGQKNSKELLKAKELCKYYNVEQICMNIKELFKYSSSSMLKSSNVELPKISYQEQLKNNIKEVSTNIAFRNGILLSIATSIAISKKIDKIYYGIHNEGIATTLYPDCCENFNLAMNLAIYIGSGNKVKVEAPLVNMLKAEVIKLRIELDVPFEKTWTCYENKKKPCQRCTACIDRIEGFKKNNLIDPLLK